MSLSTMMLCVSATTLMAAGVSAQSMRVSVRYNNATAKEVVDEIERQTDYLFVYSDDVIDLSHRVTINAVNRPVNDVLDKVFENTSIGYAVHGENILLALKASLGQTPQARQQLVSGVVRDESGHPIAGAMVNVKGTAQTVITDTNGTYAIAVPDESAVLVFSILGFGTQEFLVGQNRTLNVTMKSSLEEIEEVVVIGYGTARRRDLTGATGRVNASDIQNKPSNNVMDFLRGTVAGFNSSMNTSAKGGGTMQIRGATSITANNNPLIVLDGMIYNGDIADINPADIESIDILKDGSSAAVYGTRAAAGVLAITTKRGVTEKPVINFNASWGLSQLIKVRESYGAGEYLDYAATRRRTYDNFTKPEWYYGNPDKLPSGVTLEQWMDGAVGDPTTVWLQGRLGFSDRERLNYLAGNSVNWFDEVFQTGFRQDYNVGIGGKTNLTNYYFSLGYLNNQGIIMGDEYENFRARLNLTTDVTDWLQIGTNLQFSNRAQGTNPATTGSLFLWSPYATVFEEDGKTYAPIGFGNDTPFLNYAGDVMDTYTTLNANLFANVKLPFGIKYQMVFNNQYAFQKYYTFYDETTYIGRPIASASGEMLAGAAYRRNNSVYAWQVDNIFTWNKTFADIHRLEATFLINAEKRQTWTDAESASLFSPNTALGYHNLSTGTVRTIGYNSTYETAEYRDKPENMADTYSTGTALMGRINYALMDKYLLTASFRKDGYSAFGQSHPFGYFPAVAIAWRLSEEGFMERVDWLDNLKIRLSWGVNGNRDIGIYSALSQIGTGYNIVGGSSVSAITSTTLANSDLRWEKTTSYNAGFDFSIFKNVLSGSVDGYYMSTRDLLLRRALPNLTGYTSVMANLGEITNRGMEVTLTSNNINRDNFKWSSNLVFSFNRNRIEHLYGTKQNVLDAKGNIIGQREADDTTNGWYIGQALDRVYDYDFVGVWQEHESDEAAKYGMRPGDAKLRDVTNFEGRAQGIRADEDRVFLGYTQPRYRLGLRNSFNLFKNFDMSFYLRADLGHVRNATDWGMAINVPATNLMNTVKIDHWTPENPSNTVPRYATTVTPTYGWYISRSFLRLQDVSLSYTLPAKALQAVRIQSARVFINVNNLITISDYRLLWDPETSSPTPRIFSLGLNITL